MQWTFLRVLRKSEMKLQESPFFLKLRERRWVFMDAVFSYFVGIYSISVWLFVDVRSIGMLLLVITVVICYHVHQWIISNVLLVVFCNACQCCLCNCC